jgi:hypothetical protein
MRNLSLIILTVILLGLNTCDGFLVPAGTNIFTVFNSASKKSSSPSNSLKPTPSLIASDSVTPKFTPFPTYTPEPTQIPIPTPNPLPLNQQIFNVEINLLEAVVPFVQIDGEDTQGLPLTINLNGGRHDFLVGDVSTTCRIAKAVIIDKDHTKFIYKSGVDCIPGKLEINP